ncbi:hypothetical protein BV898_13066 [Hypsibius exemplaris]|uniref:Uncharacterized protein n=1 Tax=Hypsibius exemplaris TaxID=2072580 RepID=A0A1W0WBW0_HYPEX|nr:hypothetical protein BV898_13066 [Hypsibius exemplaris]
MKGLAGSETAIIVLNFIGGMLLTSFVYVAPTCFFNLIADSRHDLHESVKDDGIIAIKSLEWFAQYNSLCVLVDLADAVFSHWIALTLTL